MSYGSYEEVAKLDMSRLRLALQTGDPVERVWAAWALGLAIGASSVPNLLQSVQGSPSSGTRRNLIAVIAGMGERSILTALAADDPAPEVRGVACQYLLRIRHSQEDEIGSFMLNRLFNDPSPVVRQSILAEQQAALSLTLEDLSKLAADEDVGVRCLAVEKLLAAKYPSYAWPLARFIDSESDGDLRKSTIESCMALYGGRTLLEIAATIQPIPALEILRLLAKAKMRFEWTQLAVLAAVDDPSRSEVIFDLLQDPCPIDAVPWLLEQWATATAIAWKARRHLINVDPNSHTERNRIENVALAITQLQSVIASTRENPPTEEDCDFTLAMHHAELRCLTTLLSALQRVE